MATRPRNVEGEAPTRTARETAERLREKMSGQHGKANRRRTAIEAGRVGAASASMPRNEAGEPPTHGARETAARLEEKMVAQRGSANRKRTSAKIAKA